MKTRLVIAVSVVALSLGACSEQDTSTQAEESSSAAPTSSAAEATTSEEETTAGEAETSATADATDEPIVMDATEAFTGDGERIWYHISLEGPDANQAMVAIATKDGKVTAYSVYDTAAPELVTSADALNTRHPADPLPLSGVAQLGYDEELDLVKSRDAQAPASMSSDALPEGTALWQGGVCVTEVGDYPEREAVTATLGFAEPMDGADGIQVLSGLPWATDIPTELGAEMYAPSLDSVVNVCGETEETLREAVPADVSIDPSQMAPAARIDWEINPQGYEIHIMEGLEPFEVNGVTFGGYVVPSYDGITQMALVTKIAKPTTFTLDTQPITSK